MLFQPALADTREEVWAGMQRCQVIQDDRTWLECMYGAKQPMRAKLGLPPASDYQQRLVPPPSATADARPHEDQPSVAMVSHRSPTVLQVLGGTAPPVAVSNLARVQYDAQGAFVVTLENGQVWRQTDAEVSPKAHLKIGTKVTVTPGALWSYNLKTDDSPHVYKVARKT